MKKTHGIFAVLCIVTLSACFSPWTGGGEGTITISFGTTDQVGRVAVQPGEIDSMTHHVTLAGPGGVIKEYSFIGRGPATITVLPGAWNVSVRAMGPRPTAYDNSFPGQMLRAIGFGEAEVRIGGNTRTEVSMISAVEVASHAQLSSAIYNARDDGGEKIIIITGDITAKDQYPIEATASNITLVSDTDITITRSSENAGVMFDVAGEGKTLTLGRPGMGGSITIDGGIANTIADGSIIRVSGGANLVMNRNITLTGNNRSAGLGSNGGAVEVGEGGTFDMNGGVISNNSAVRGGGVYVAYNGIFIMNGGVIYGTDRPSSQNSAVLGGASLFVAIGGIARYGEVFVATYGINVTTTDNTLPHVFTADARAFTINFAQFHEVGPIPGPTIAVGETAVFSVENPVQYDPGSIAWFMDGIRITGAAVSGINGETLTVGPSLHGKRVMMHFVTLEVSMGGKWYSQVIALEVVPGDANQ